MKSDFEKFINAEIEKNALKRRAYDAEDMGDFEALLDSIEESTKDFYPTIPDEFSPVERYLAITSRSLNGLINLDILSNEDTASR